MNQNFLRHGLGAFVLLTAILACALPSQAVQPTPGIDANAMGTSVAGTAQAAVQQTAAAQPAATHPTGATLERASDGTTTYTNYDGGFQVSFPAGWLAVRPNSDEFNPALAKEGAANRMLGDQMKFDLTQYNADFEYLYIYILRPDLKKNFLFGISDVIWDSKDTRPLNNATLSELVRGAEASSKFAGFHADTAQLHEDGAVKTIEIGGPFTMTNAQGDITSFYKTNFYFKSSSDSMVFLTFTIMQEHRTKILQDVNFIIDSIRIIDGQQ